VCISWKLKCWILLMHSVTMILLMHGVTMLLLMHGVTMILLMHDVTMKFILFVCFRNCRKSDPSHQDNGHCILLY